MSITRARLPFADVYSNLPLEDIRQWGRVPSTKKSRLWQLPVLCRARSLAFHFPRTPERHRSFLLIVRRKKGKECDWMAPLSRVPKVGRSRECIK